MIGLPSVNTHSTDHDGLVEKSLSYFITGISSTAGYW
jgi:hypothetical protein